jgi:hypothetical protein
MSEEITFKVTFVEILLWNPFKMKKFNHKKKYYSNLRVFKDEIALLFQIANSFQTRRLACGLRGYELGKIFRLGTRTPYRVRVTWVLCITDNNVFSIQLYLFTCSERNGFGFDIYFHEKIRKKNFKYWQSIVPMMICMIYSALPTFVRFKLDKKISKGRLKDILS